MFSIFRLQFRPFATLFWGCPGWPAPQRNSNVITPSLSTKLTPVFSPSLRRLLGVFGSISTTFQDLETLDQSESIIPCIKIPYEHQISTQDFIWAILSAAPGAELLGHDIIDAVRKIDREWANLAEDDGSDDVIILKLVGGLKENLAIGERLAEWGKEWLMEFLLPFYAANRISQNISYNAAYHQWHNEALKLMLNPVTEVARQRDGCRGPIQGDIDGKAPDKERYQLLAKYPDADISPTMQPAYIFPFSIAQLESSSFQLYVERFSGNATFLEDVAGDANDIRNIVLMDATEYIMFAQFGLSIEYMGDQYILRMFDEKFPDRFWKVKDRPLTSLHTGPAGKNVKTHLSGELCNLHCAVAKVLNILPSVRGCMYQILEAEEDEKESGGMHHLLREVNEGESPTARRSRLVAMAYLDRKCRQLQVINSYMAYVTDNFETHSSECSTE